MNEFGPMDEYWAGWMNGGGRNRKGSNGIYLSKFLKLTHRLKHSLEKPEILFREFLPTEGV